MSLKASLGTTTFALTFGTKSAKSAFGTCVSRFTPTGNAAVSSARTACAGKTGKTFAACVQLRADAKVNTLKSSFKNAALVCRAQLQSLGLASFATKYSGVNHNLANAYGKCVSSHVSHKTHAPATTTTTTTTTATTDHFGVTLNALNSSGASGTATLTLKENELTVEVSLTGLVANQPHPLFIGSGSTCPTASADTNADGIVSQSEGQTAFGTSLLELTPIPTSTGAGTVAFTRVYTVAPGTLKPLEDRTLVVQGLTVKGSYDQTTPAACGQIPG